MSIEWMQDGVNSEFRPTLYPGEKADNWEVPEELQDDFYRLNSIIESKYSREFLKICAFCNKMFPSLKTANWTRTSYNVAPFTLMDQERTDTGNGTNYNYLKEIIDQITSRLGTVEFMPMITSEVQSYEFILYKDIVEHVLRSFIRDDSFNRICLESFHNAAVLGYSHAFIDPYTGNLLKACDYEIGIYESEFNYRHISHMLYRNYMFPTAEIYPYIKDLPEAAQQEVIESVSNSSAVDLKMYFDTVNNVVQVLINNKAMPEKEYPFEYVLVNTFQWDTGFGRQHTTSEFDKLYPIQREINKIAAKIQQLVRMYKGAVPVFNSDVDLSVKQLSNGSGECLYVDTTRPVDSLMTVINPTPLDAQLSAQIQEYKTTMYELSGLQNASFDMENMRSAAAVVALDQTRDAVFQAQMSAMSQFIKDSLRMYVTFYAKSGELAKTVTSGIDWETVDNLLASSYIDLKPVHLNDPLSDSKVTAQEPLDYKQITLAKTLVDVIKGKLTYKTLPYYINTDELNLLVATVITQFTANSIEIPDTVHQYLLTAFVDQIRLGNIAI